MSIFIGHMKYMKKSQCLETRMQLHKFIFLCKMRKIMKIKFTERRETVEMLASRNGETVEIKFKILPSLSSLFFYKRDMCCHLSNFLLFSLLIPVKVEKCSDGSTWQMYICPCRTSLLSLSVTLHKPVLVAALIALLGWRQCCHLSVSKFLLELKR